MIRRNAVAVKVKAPSRGLITRWPSEIADLFNAADPSALKRVCARAQNMRFEDGTMSAAPGYSRVQIVTPLLANCIAHWRMDEASGTRYDAAGNNHLSAGPDTPATAGKLGQSVILDGGGGTLSAVLPALTLQAAPFTITCWAYFTEVSGDDLVKTLLAYGAEYSIAEAAGALVLTLGGGSVTSSVTIAAGQWYFIAAQWDGANLKIRVNSTVSSVGYGGGATPGTTLVMGDGAGQAFYLDSVTVWTRALSSGELDTVYNSAAGLDYPFLSGTATLLYVGNLLAPLGRPLLYATPTAIYSMSAGWTAGVDPTWVPSYAATLTKLGTAPAPPDTGHRWRAADFFDKVVLAQSNGPPLYSVAGTAATLPVPGLPTSATYDGVEAFAGHLLFWKDDKLVWSDLNDFAQYIPVGVTSNSQILALTSPLVQPAISSTATASFTVIGSALVPLQFLRLVALVNKYITLATLNAAGTGYAVNDTITLNTGVGNKATVKVLTIGVGGAVATFIIVSAGNYTVAPASGDATTTSGAGTGAKFNVTVADGGGALSYNYYQAPVGGTQTTSAADLQRLDKVGGAPAGVALSGNILTLDANEAGAAQVVGSNVNGPILQIVAVGEYAYLFKEWSVQSLQYVGQAAGTFYMRTEIVREGLIGRNSWTNLGNGQVVFLGHRELYAYQGGPTPSPVCRQYTRQLFAELDRGNVDSVFLYHKEPRNEVWVVYPVQGGLKALIWNYVEDSVSIDLYSPQEGLLTAAARVTWIIDPAWSTGSDSQTWNSFADTATWASFTNTGLQDLSLLGMDSGKLFIHGSTYDRDGAAYTALAETTDFDFEDPAAFKYLDVIHVGLQVLAPDSQVRNLYIQAGCRSTLDADLTWTPAQAINVQGNANFTAKVNTGGAGRYVRLRFYSADAGLQWRISSFEIYARAGGTY